MTALSDGRELIYFDEDGRPPRTARDERGLSRVEHSSELRYDRLLDAWVTVASERQERIYLPAADACPFCPSRPGRPSEIPESDYDVVVFENRFPSFSGTGIAAPILLDTYDERPAVGRCEVVCFTPDHDASFAGLSPEQARLVLEAWTDRTAALLGRAGVAEVYCFENRGPEIGVTEQHPHGQIYAYPFVTPRTSRMLAAARRHEDLTGSNLFDDVVEAERSDGSRVVVSGANWTAFVPRAARWPFEVHLYPHRRVPDLTGLSGDEREEFCEIYLGLLRRFDALFAMAMPYISGWHQAPVGLGAGFALHLELFSIRRAPDKLKYLAGSESGMDAFISDIAPESAAARLREAR